MLNSTKGKTIFFLFFISLCTGAKTVDELLSEIKTGNYRNEQMNQGAKTVDELRSEIKTGNYRNEQMNQETYTKGKEKSWGSTGIGKSRSYKDINNKESLVESFLRLDPHENLKSNYGFNCCDQNKRDVLGNSIGFADEFEKKELQNRLELFNARLDNYREALRENSIKYADVSQKKKLLEKLEFISSKLDWKTGTELNTISIYTPEDNFAEMFNKIDSITASDRIKLSEAVLKVLVVAFNLNKLKTAQKNNVPFLSKTEFKLLMVGFGYTDKLPTDADFVAYPFSVFNNVDKLNILLKNMVCEAENFRSHLVLLIVQYYNWLVTDHENPQKIDKRKASDIRCAVAKFLNSLIDPESEQNVKDMLLSFDILTDVFPQDTNLKSFAINTARTKISLNCKFDTFLENYKTNKEILGVKLFAAYFFIGFLFVVFLPFILLYYAVTSN